MIIYQCRCGDYIQIEDNSEASRRMKKRFKKKHDRKNPGHGWKREKAKKERNF